MLDRLVVLVTLPGLSPGDTEEELAKECERPTRCRGTFCMVVAMIEGNCNRLCQIPTGDNELGSIVVLRWRGRLAVKRGRNDDCIRTRMPWLV